MPFHISKKDKSGRKEYKILLSNDIYLIIRNYADKEEKGFNEAMEELIYKGYKYYQLEKLYDKDVNDRKVWDRRYYFLTVEGRYLHYKLRVRELIEELKNQTLQLLSILSQLESCYKRYLPEGEVRDKEIKRVKKMKESVKQYADKYLFSSRDGSAEDVYVDDMELIKSIEKALSKYKKVFKNIDGQRPKKSDDTDYP